VTLAEGPRRTAGVAAPTPKSLREFVDRSGLRSLVIGVSKDPNAKLTILLVEPGSGRPTLVVKAATTDDAARAIEAEMDTLHGLRQLHPWRSLHTLPSVVDLLELDGRPAMVTTAVAGEPMSTSYLRWRHTSSHDRVAADFAAASAWLAEFQSETAAEPAPLDLGSGVASRLRERFAGDDRLGADIARLDRIYERLRANLVKRSAVHGDFWFGNLLTTGERVSGVVDWEAGAVAGEPVRDLVRFALMYALYLDRRTRPGRRVRGHRQLRAEGWGAGVEYALDREGWFPDLFRRFLCHGLSRLGAAPECWRDAALAGIAEVAALTDDPEFSRRHLNLFRRLPELPPHERPPACLGSAT
jgi:aminoglycoside phosphotransferase (APT) family kinase protein